MSDLTTWRKKLQEVLDFTGERLEDLTITLTDKELDVEFDCGYGGKNGQPFTAWGEKYVYFPACHDGAEWVAYVSRNPNGEPTEHVGGGWA